MKTAIIALLFVACASAAEDKAASIVSFVNQQNPEGNYEYAFQTDNGISGNAQGQLKTINKDESAVVVSGGNSYISPEGESISLTYIADENGYQPQGSHLPTPPAPIAIPEYIARAIAYIAAHPYTEKKN
ncbi:larval cuticle protein LCP-14-like [Trichoplusia ni]|uniref:Larval cuticle protein LCP-14-like n=1 Tax=Trichoplusia ni TaxID=7111 RepID=A0A7E5W241_TRINI|nr:larval cuticle protein LCP-14-like [Trichoplusia ni]